jgi:hypothetical protein
MRGRDQQGRFPKGMSGNTRGRPKAKKHRLETPEDLDDIILQIANRKVPGDASRGMESIDIFTYNVLLLGTGAAKNRIATKDFIEMVRGAAVRKKRLEEAVAADEERQQKIAELNMQRGY